MPVGPHPLPWPDDPRLDPELLLHGDSRNVLDCYRYWTVAAIVEHLRQSRMPLHVGIENLQHDLNIGSIVRTANAFNVAGVHIVGRRRWNRRGAMVTDAYLDIHHHLHPGTLKSWCEDQDIPIFAIDMVAGSQPIESSKLPSPALLLFGQEGPGLSDEALCVASAVLHITQYGSTRSMNVAAAAAIAMHYWVTNSQAGLVPQEGKLLQ